jgi:hypothetical protein
MANRGEAALWGLFERARLLRKDAFKLSRRLGKTCDEIEAREVKRERAIGKPNATPFEKKDP